MKVKELRKFLKTRGVELKTLTTPREKIVSRVMHGLERDLYLAWSCYHKYTIYKNMQFVNQYRNIVTQNLFEDIDKWNT